MTRPAPDESTRSICGRSRRDLSGDGRRGRGRVLQVVDDLTTGVHHGAATALPSRLQYLRIAGSNISPLCIPAAEFPRRAALRGAELTAEHGTVPAGDKLAGASLGNFSAFISERWRANDWMWGRLDAAKSIVDVATTKGRLRGDHATTIDGSTDRDASLVVAPGTPRGVVGRARCRPRRRSGSATHPTVAAELRTEHDESEATRLCVTKRLLVLRRQWEILAEELPGVLAASLRPDPTPAAAPTRRPRSPRRSPTTTSPRSFGDVWGMRWSTAARASAPVRAVVGHPPAPPPAALAAHAAEAGPRSRWASPWPATAPCWP